MNHDAVTTLIEAALGAPRHYGPTPEEAEELARSDAERAARTAAAHHAAEVGWMSLYALKILPFRLLTFFSILNLKERGGRRISRCTCCGRKGVDHAMGRGPETRTGTVGCGLAALAAFSCETRHADFNSGVFLLFGD